MGTFGAFQPPRPLRLSRLGGQSELDGQGGQNGQSSYFGSSSIAFCDVLWQPPDDVSFLL